jgi:hypothetical protein
MDQAQAWELLYRLLRRALAKVAKEGVGEENDCWLDDDNLGSLQQKTYIWNLELLRPSLISALQGLLVDFPGWEIRVAIAGPKDERSWPVMGLTIRAHEIIDGLQRQFFPEPYRHFRYEGARPGTEFD